MTIPVVLTPRLPDLRVITLEPSDARGHAVNEFAERSDEDLLIAFAKGADAAFEELVRRHGRGIKSYAYRLLRNDEQAEDVYVETFTRVVRERKNLRKCGTARGYLYTIAHRICIGQIRRRRTEIDAMPHLVALDGRRATQPNSEALAAAGELAADIEQAIACLSQQHRQVLLLRTVHGLSTRDVAEALEVDEVQVRSQLSWARKRLRLLLAERVESEPLRRTEGVGR